MSKRYVWNQYECVAKLGPRQTVSSYRYPEDGSRGTHAGKSYTISKNLTRFYYTVTSATALNAGNGFRNLKTADYPYISNAFNITEEEDDTLLQAAQDSANWYWKTDDDGTIRTRDLNGNYSNFYLYKGFTFSKGVLTAKISAREADYYPEGKSGFDYYEYLGSDTIDPSSLSYSKTELQGGEPVTITVTPVAPTYGGTVSYQYAYSTNGGASWTNAGSKTTETTKTITVPSGVSQFQARVQASDDMGFTSADYVLGQAMSVISMQAYVGVGNKARRIDKIYIGVNGKAREVVAGYVGVNGKARKFL